jgi:hypothetical protein
MICMAQIPLCRSIETRVRSGALIDLQIFSNRWCDLLPTSPIRQFLNVSDDKKGLETVWQLLIVNWATVCASLLICCFALEASMARSVFVRLRVTHVRTLRDNWTAVSLIRASDLQRLSSPVRTRMCVCNSANEVHSASLLCPSILCVCAQPVKVNAASLGEGCFREQVVRRTEMNFYSNFLMCFSRGTCSLFG